MPVYIIHSNATYDYNAEKKFFKPLESFYDSTNNFRNNSPYTHVHVKSL